MSEYPDQLYNGDPVHWKEIEESARRLFNVWLGGKERQWGKKAWEILAACGLTRCTDAIEETGVQVRLLTLAIVYREWCWLAREESCHEGSLVEMAVEDAGINAFRVAQLIGRDFAKRDMESDQDELLEQALVKLIDRERPVICRALVEGFGGAVPLHNLLGATTRGNDSDEDASDSVEDFASGQALSWIMQGMQRL